MSKRRFRFILVIYLVLAVTSFFVEIEFVKAFLLAIILYSATLTKGINQFIVYMCVSVVLDIDNYILLLLVSLPLYISVQSYKSVTKYIVPLAITVILSVLSFRFGIDSQFGTMAVYFTSILVFIQVLDSDLNVDELWSYTILSATIVLLVLLVSSARGDLSIKFGRLAINDNIRALADAIAFPAFLSWSLMLKRSGRKISYIVIGIISSFILLLTISKGAIAATIIGVLVVFLTSGRKSIQRNLLVLLLITPILYFMYSYASSFDTYNFERLGEEYGGLSGRTEIWSMYLYLLFDNPSTVLLGFGPGDVRRLVSESAYAHSLFLDMFFSYGAIMAVVWITILFLMLRTIIKSHNSLSLGIFIFTILLFATHGVVTYPVFYIQMAISVAISKSDLLMTGNYENSFSNHSNI